MLKLSQLFENFDLAKNALNDYYYDDKLLNSYLPYFRISANHIYPYPNQGKTNFLRLTPTDRRTFDDVKAELEYIQYLNQNNYPCLKINSTKDGTIVKQIKYENRDYIIASFQKVQGDSLDDYIEDNGINAQLAYKYGQALGKMHKLSENYQPINERYGIERFLEVIEKNLSNNDADKQIINKFNACKEYLLSLPKTKDNYGMIHYDLELDNIFYDNDNDILSAIDFDDCFNGFYIIDYYRSLKQLSPFDLSIQGSFSKGYQSIKQIDVTIDMSIIKTICAIQHYGEIINTLNDEINDKPDWMDEIIEKLNNMKKELEKSIL